MINSFERQVDFWTHMLDSTEHKDSKSAVIAESKKEVIIENKMTREEYDDFY